MFATRPDAGAGVCAGQTAYLPGGWLQAQLAVTDGSAAAGRWLHRGALGCQIAAWKLAVGWNPYLVWVSTERVVRSVHCTPPSRQLSGRSAAERPCTTLHGRPIIYACIDAHHADLAQEDAPEEQLAAFRGFLWRVAVAAARRLQAKAGLSQDGLTAKVLLLLLLLMVMPQSWLPLRYAIVPAAGW